MPKAKARTKRDLQEEGGSKAEPPKSGPSALADAREALELKKIQKETEKLDEPEKPAEPKQDPLKEREAALVARETALDEAETALKEKAEEAGKAEKALEGKARDLRVKESIADAKINQYGDYMAQVKEIDAVKMTARHTILEASRVCFAMTKALSDGFYRAHGENLHYPRSSPMWDGLWRQSGSLFAEFWAIAGLKLRIAAQPCGTTTAGEAIVSLKNIHEYFSNPGIEESFYRASGLRAALKALEVPSAWEIAADEFVEGEYKVDDVMDEAATYLDPVDEGLYEEGNDDSDG